MLHLLKYLDGPWETMREYLRADLDHIESAINAKWGATFDLDENTLLSSVIPGDSTADTRYISNEGTNHSPKWAQVNLANGVKNRLPYANFTASANPSRVLMRQASSAGDWQEGTLSGSLIAEDTPTLYDIGGTVAMHQLCGGI